MTEPQNVVVTPLPSPAPGRGGNSLRFDMVPEREMIRVKVVATGKIVELPRGWITEENQDLYEQVKKKPAPAPQRPKLAEDLPLAAEMAKWSFDKVKAQAASEGLDVAEAPTKEAAIAAIVKGRG